MRLQLHAYQVMRCHSVFNKTSLGYIPAVPGLVLTLRENIRSSGTELGGTVTTTQTLNCPTPSTTLYDGCSNPISTAEKMFVRYDLYYNTPSNVTYDHHPQLYFCPLED